MLVTEATPVAELIFSVISPLQYYSEQARVSECAKYTAHELKTLVSEDQFSVLIAKSGDELAGFCISRYDDGVIWLEWFGTHAKFRSSGVGLKLLESLDAATRARGCKKIWCDTRTDNLKSQRTLQRAEYKKLCTLTEHWYGHDFHLWEKRL